MVLFCLFRRACVWFSSPPPNFKRNSCVYGAVTGGSRPPCGFPALRSAAAAGGSCLGRGGSGSRGRGPLAGGGGRGQELR